MSFLYCLNQAELEEVTSNCSVVATNDQLVDAPIGVPKAIEVVVLATLDP